MSQKIIIASGSVIIEDRKVLVTKHGDTEFWKFCGGTLALTDENLRACAVREAREWAWLPIDNLPADVGPNIIPTLKHFGFL